MSSLTRAFYIHAAGLCKGSAKERQERSWKGLAVMLCASPGFLAVSFCAVDVRGSLFKTANKKEKNSRRIWYQLPSNLPLLTGQPDNFPALKTGTSSPFELEANVKSSVAQIWNLLRGILPRLCTHTTGLVSVQLTNKKLGKITQDLLSPFFSVRKYCACPSYRWADFPTDVFLTAFPKSAAA